jgi:hypothetical protein
MVDFRLGDIVELDEDFEGKIDVLSWDRDDFIECSFEVVSLEEFTMCHPKLAKKVKAKRTGDDVFLKCLVPNPDSNVFAMHPASALTLVDAAELVCRCPIQRLWRGSGHFTGCAEGSK